ncbi:HAD family hydrolase [Fictibacillus sp. BK138]|uniref:HAD family hydrolase n=1 Tax=Fictibacillus sp. BK138 TaxID=2512121 RepID=UPI001029DDD1|nr:HAD family hydrolase [Fictibacillus sp. BK138]RZT23800.1 putative hydrolase of the HAD superfamily [Fictibacillus sp. BK138]
MIKAVFFDLYETLITEWNGNQKKAVYSTDELGLDPKVFKIEWDSRRELRMNGTFPDHPSVLRDILNSHDLSPDLDLIEKVHQQRVWAKTVPFQEMHPEVIELLATLKEKGMKLGLISNCAPEEVFSWNTSKLADYFDAVVFSYEVKVAKPSSEIYHIACKKLGVTPEEAIFIGDGGANELVGATEAGLKAYHATWFLPEKISSKIIGYPKLKTPSDLLIMELARY